MLVKLLVLLRHCFLHGLLAALIRRLDKCLFMGLHIGQYPLQVGKDKFFQYAFTDIMRGAKLPGSDTVSVFPASVSVFAFQCSGSLLQIHFVAAISTKEKSRKNVDFVYFRRAMFGSNPFLCKVKGFFINQRFMCVREEVLLFFRVLLCLFDL